MKLKTAGFLTAWALMLIAGNANANLLFDIYGGATVGVGAATTFADSHAHTENAQSYGAFLGIDLPIFRVEAEYDYLHQPDINMHLGMVNAYAKMPSLAIMPYLGVGVGAMFDGDAPNGISLDTTMAYQAMLGLTFDLPVLPFKIDAEARALYTPDIFDENGITPDVLHYDARIKLRYIF